MQVPLPRHVYNVALEESLLLQAYRTLCGVYVGHQCPPVITMFSRNDILELAYKHLEPESYEAMVQYAATLDRHLNCEVVVDFPKPVGSLSPKATEAEQLAWHCLAEGSGSIWASVRSVVPKLPFDRDTRKFSKGFICTLGLMAKRGTHGLTRQTGGHLNVCRLIDQLVLAICPGLRWSSLTITLDNLCQPHTDMGNWSGDSLALGLSHHDAGGLWIAHPQGCDFVEVGDTLYAGEVHPTSAQGIVFPGKTAMHSTCPWTGGNRLMLIAYCVSSHASAPAALQQSQRAWLRSP